MGVAIGIAVVCGAFGRHACGTYLEMVQNPAALTFVISIIMTAGVPACRTPPGRPPDEPLRLPASRSGSGRLAALAGREE